MSGLSAFPLARASRLAVRRARHLDRRDAITDDPVRPRASASFQTLTGSQAAARAHQYSGALPPRRYWAARCIIQRTGVTGGATLRRGGPIGAPPARLPGGAGDPIPARARVAFQGLGERAPLQEEMR